MIGTPTAEEAGRVIDTIVSQHAAETIFLWRQRYAATRSVRSTVHRLSQHDDRIEAHIDGLRVAGLAGEHACLAQLSFGEPGAMFAAMVLALESRSPRRVATLLSLGEAVPEMQPGLMSAFGWSAAEQLRGVVAPLLNSSNPFERLVAIAACAMHRVDPGIARARRFEDESAIVRARALRAAGELGCRELVSTCAAAIADDDLHCRFWAAWSAVLLGDRNNGLNVLVHTALEFGIDHPRALRIALLAASPTAAHTMLQKLNQHPGRDRLLITGSGLVGDPTYVPWLIRQMGDDKLARVSGEAFTMITGVDLSASGLESSPPSNLESGPSDDPEDPNVAMDEDEGLPWPDLDKVGKWWKGRGGTLQPGVRYFLGVPVTREQCLRVLKTGNQRQRIAAAHHLCLLQPGTPLFNTSAPAWRQQLLLAQMT